MRLLLKRCSNWAGPTAATCKSKLDGPETTHPTFADRTAALARHREVSVCMGLRGGAGSPDQIEGSHDRTIDDPVFRSTILPISVDDVEVADGKSLMLD
ncbi:MAG: hypothetical protein WAK55_14225 [Xanthobacteraceae bacterium]